MWLKIIILEQKIIIKHKNSKNFESTLILSTNQMNDFR
jgi:hypothetical protein